MNTFTLPSYAAPSTFSATLCVTSSATSCAASFACSSFSCHLKVNLGDQVFVGRGFRRWKMTRATTNT